MTKLELLNAINSMTVGEQLEILEITSKLVRSRLSNSTPLSERTDLEMAAAKMHSYYAEGMVLFKIFNNP
jgi:hypothetical protein